MPIYKVSKRGSTEQRSRALFVRLRLVAVLLSLLFIFAAVALLYYCRT